MYKKALKMGTSSIGALLGNLGEGSYVGGLCLEERSGMVVCPYSGPIGGPWEGDPSTGNFERCMKRALVLGRLSQKRLTAEGLEGRLLYWVPCVMKGRLWGQASPFMGAQLGNVEWARLPEALRDGRKGLWRWGVSFYGSSVKGTWRGGTLAGDPRGWVERREAPLSIGAPLRNLEGFLSWTQRSLRFEVWRPPGTFSKEQDSPELISDYGAQTAHL